MASPIVVDRPSWDVTMEKRLRELFTYGLKKNDDWKKMWKTVKSDKYREEVAEYATPDVTVETPEGAPYVTLNMSIVRTSAAVAVDYTGQIIITHQMKRDKKYSEMEDQTWGLAEAVARKPHEMAVKYFYEGFDTKLSSDQQPWFSASHPLKNDALHNDSNLITTAFGPQGINDAIVALMKTRNENGKPIPMGQGKVLVYTTPINWMLGEQLLDKNAYFPDSNNFNKNKLNFELIIDPFLNLTDASHADSQFYVQDPTNNKNTMYEREGPNFETITDPHTDNTIIKARHAFSFNLSGHRGTVGSKGQG